MDRPPHEKFGRILTSKKIRQKMVSKIPNSFNYKEERMNAIVRMVYIIIENDNKSVSIIKTWLPLLLKIQDKVFFFYKWDWYQNQVSSK